MNKELILEIECEEENLHRKQALLVPIERGETLLLDGECFINASVYEKSEGAVIIEAPSDYQKRVGGTVCYTSGPNIISFNTHSIDKSLVP